MEISLVVICRNKVSCSSSIYVVQNRSRSVVLSCMLSHSLILLRGILQGSQRDGGNTVDVAGRDYGQAGQTMTNQGHHLSTYLVNFSSQVLQLLVCNEVAFQFFFQSRNLLVYDVQRSQLVDLVLQFFLQSFQVVIRNTTFCRTGLVQSFLSLVLSFVGSCFSIVDSCLQSRNFCSQLFK